MLLDAALTQSRIELKRQAYTPDAKGVLAE